MPTRARPGEAGPETSVPGDGIRAGVVLPGDNRQAVPDSTSPPSCWIGQLVCRWRDGSTTWGTVPLLDDRHLITCAHNFFDTATGLGCTEAQFRPGLSHDARGSLVEPFGYYPVLR